MAGKFILQFFYIILFLGISFVPLHDRILHFFVCLRFPLHLFPPPEGGGLVHERVRVFFPLPQVLLHLLNADQLVNPPSTDIVEIKVIKLEHLLSNYHPFLNYAWDPSPAQIKLCYGKRCKNQTKKRKKERKKERATNQTI